MSAVIIDVAENLSAAQLTALWNSGVRTIVGYMSSINPTGGKCLTADSVKAYAAAGFTIALVHEGYGGVGGRGVSASDGTRDGEYCRNAAPGLGATEGACIYFAVDTDESPSQEQSLVLPYFHSIKQTDMGDGEYRIGVYGSGLTCSTVKNAGLCDLTWLAGSTGWTNYSTWKAKANMVQTVDANVAGVPDDSDVAQGDIGDYTPRFS